MPDGQMLIKFVKEPTGFIQKMPDGQINGLFLITFSMYPVISLRSKGGLFLNELSICPLGKVWVNCLKSLKKPSIYLQGKTPSAPSGMWLSEVCSQRRKPEVRDMVFDGETSVLDDG